MSEDNIFREVDEELRSEKLRNLWRRAAPFVIGAAIAIVVLVAVNEGWSWYSNNEAAKASDTLYTALEMMEEDPDGARARLETLAANGWGGYPVLARFGAAQALAETGDAAGAAALYDQLATSLETVRLRELALLHAARIMVDVGSPADVEARLASLAGADSALRRPARELIGLAHYKAGDFAAAQASFEAVLNDPLAQAPTRNRMSYYLAQLLSQGVVTPAPAEAGSPPEEGAAGPEGQ